MSPITFVRRVCLLIILLQESQMVSTEGLDNMTNVIDLTSNNFDEKITHQNLFVLFYEDRLVSHI